MKGVYQILMVKRKTLWREKEIQLKNYRITSHIKTLKEFRYKIEHIFILLSVLNLIRKIKLSLYFLSSKKKKKLSSKVGIICWVVILNTHDLTLYILVILCTIHVSFYYCTLWHMVHFIPILWKEAYKAYFNKKSLLYTNTRIIVWEPGGPSS